MTIKYNPPSMKDVVSKNIIPLKKKISELDNRISKLEKKDYLVENNKELAELAKFIARKIFECGDDIYSKKKQKTQRIQFMGGTYPDNEIALGGFGEQPLADFIEQILDEYKK